MSDEISDKMMDRIAKLLALAGNNPSAEEAASAMAKAQAILAEYNLSMADVEARQGKKSAPGNAQHDPVTMHYAQWALPMISSIAGLYMCRVIYIKQQQRKAKYIFIGKPHNAQVAIQFARKVVNDSLSTANRKQRELGMPGSYATSFLYAAADQIVQRCYKLVQAAKAGQMQGMSSSRALVLASLYDQEDELNKALMGDAKKVAAKRTRVEDFLGTVHGAIYGDTVAIQQAVTDGSKEPDSRTG